MTNAIELESSHNRLKIFLIGWLIIVAIVVALLLLFGAYQGIRRLVGQGDYYTPDYCEAIGGNRIKHVFLATRWLGFMIIVVYLAVALLELFFLYIIWQLYKFMASNG